MVESSAEIISIGTEILLGEITDTNSVFIAQKFCENGINVYHMSSVGDNVSRICDAVTLAISRSNIVILSGGLGPTVDDMTREGVAKAFGYKLVFHQYLLDNIAQRFETFNVQMTNNNRRQAYLPEHSHVIDNPVGTAPAFYIERDNTIVICLPGVPREMKFLFDTNVMPLIRSRFEPSVIKKVVYHTAGIGESSLDTLIGADLLEMANPTIGLAAHHGSVDIRLTAKAATKDQAEDMIVQFETILLARVGNYVYGKDGASLDSVLVDQLTKCSEKLVITQIGIQANVDTLVSSDYIQVVSYDALDAFSQHHQINSTDYRDIAQWVSDYQLKNTSSTISVAVISDPNIDEGGDNETSTAITVTDGVQSKSRMYGFGGKSETAKSWVINWSLSYVLQMLKDKYGG